jgi:2-haloacid dehalogenase
LRGAGGAPISNPVPSFSDVRAVVFDAYGTLFDTTSAAQRSKDALGERWGPLAETWRAKQLQYTWLRGLQGRHADFAQVTADALDFALESLGIADPELRGRLLALYERADAYPDARETLARLRAAGRRTAVLSNGTPRMLGAAAAHAGLAPLLDLVLSIEEVGVFKPHPAVYRLAGERLGLEEARILFVSANGWDAFAASASGLRVAWCNRSRQPAERLPGAPDVVVRSLAEVAALVTG